MRAVIQRVKSATVTISGKQVSSIDHGMLVLLGVVADDTSEDIQWLSNKLAGLRIFDDLEGVMNLSVAEVGGSILCVSQFTLYARTKKGFRPSYIDAAPPDIAIPLYEEFVRQIGLDLGKEIKTGEFGAEMDVALINDGPVTIIIDTKDKK